MVPTGFKNNRDQNRDKILATSNHPKTPETYLCQYDVFGFELRRLRYYYYYNIIGGSAIVHPTWLSKRDV